MISNKSKKWIDAGIILSKDPKMKVLCPECTQTNLEVQDVRNQLNPNQFERIIYCPTCKAQNILRF